MFSIIGADGQEYGPVAPEVLAQWIAEGRANALTRVRAAGADAWKPLGDVPEFAAPLEARYGAKPAAAQPPHLPQPAPTPDQPSPRPSPQPQLAVAPGARAAAIEQLRAPAVFMMIVAACGLALELLGIVNVSVFNLMPFEHPPWFGRGAALGMLIQIPFLVVNIALYGLSVFAAANMLQLRRWGWCLTGAIALVVPCTGCCCCLGVLSGLWGMIVLTRPGVRAAFAP
ncbi:MAG: DUF4339 domain-containing protein [Verrucomicrobia bacterium]|nr:DUF4339 domain-containing protein [Verrucomicrobiota bacterium]